ncbi:MAG: hypothetical protein PHF89_07155 [Eubacteriales bacterium]|jgi:peptidoglycan hydrolase CwlO-like protein|nr:hypothetical protein [Eubacteriales bacterium]
MKDKSKFIWLYSVIMFTAAILLILISSLSQSRLSPSEAMAKESEQQAFNQTIQNRVTDLVSENEKLRNEIKNFSQKIEQLEQNSESIKNEIKEKNLANEANEYLIQAEMLFNLGKSKESFEMLKNVNSFALSENGKQLYDWLREKLAAKGLKLE